MGNLLSWESKVKSQSPLKQTRAETAQTMAYSEIKKL